jgi:hypothetical protein
MSPNRDRHLETRAVYWETMIKTYGFRVSTGLSLLTLTMPREDMAVWGAKIGELDSPGPGFELVLLQAPDPEHFRMILIMEGGAAKAAHDRLGREKGFHMASPVELITFHGPHFGDRSGIAHAAFKALKDRGITLLASGCSVAHIYLVLPENRAGEAVEVLKTVFELPERHRQRIRRPRENT